MKKAKAQANPPAQPYMGPGRNEREVLLRDHGFEGNLDDQNAVNQFLSQNYGGRLPGPDDPPVAGTAAYYSWTQNNATQLQDYKNQLAALPSDQRAFVQQQIAAAQGQPGYNELKTYKDVLGQESIRQTNIQNILRDLGYTGANDAGQGTDYLLRNPDKIDPYEQQRRQYDPNYAFDRTAQSTATQARDAARTQAQSRVGARGLNYADYENDINAELDRIYKSIPYGTSNADTYFDPNFADSVLNRIEGDRRSSYQTQASNLLPEDYGSTAFADTADDDIIGRILDEQYGSARTLVDRSRDRGTLLPTGYDSALSALSNQRSAASSTLQNIGGNVLATNRGKLSDIVGEGRSAASNFRLGQTYDPQSYRTRLDTTRDELSGRLESDVRSAVGGQQLFDTSSLLNTGYQAQGAQNTGRAGILDVLAQRERERGQRRGVGNEGSF